LSLLEGRFCKAKALTQQNLLREKTHHPHMSGILRQMELAKPHYFQHSNQPNEFLSRIGSPRDTHPALASTTPDLVQEPKN
jgi:hypothetical protein